MIPRPVIERIFDAASIQRWNDRVRPVELTELDKQSHKAMIAFLLAKFEEDRGRPIDWVALIEGFLFELFPRVLLTDIKAPFFHRLMRHHGDRIREFVLRHLKPEFDAWDQPFAARFEAYLSGQPASTDERRILKAAHYLATKWEFKIVDHANPEMYEFEDTRKEIEDQIGEFIDLVGVQQIGLKQKAYGFVDLCGQLRYQQRWAQTPRTPRTSVLGHSLFVAATAYMVSLEIGACDARRRNNFFGALFHDLPEVFTRDIISPIKRGVEELEGFIDQEERVLIRERLLPLLPPSWHEQVTYFIEDPFETRIRLDGKVVMVSPDRLHAEFNSPEFDPLDGAIVKGCDELGAFVEACKSLETGINPPTLVKAVRSILKKYDGVRTGPVEWTGYFRGFADLVPERLR